MNELRDYIEAMSIEAENLVELTGFVLSAANNENAHGSGEEFNKIRLSIFNSLNYILSLMDQHSAKYDKLIAMTYQMERTTTMEVAG